MIKHSALTFNKSEIKAITGALSSNYISDGEICRKFEKTFSDYIGKRYAASTNSGTSALHLALLALNIKPNDEIILPSYVCAAVLNAVDYVRAKPILVDINQSGFNINPEIVSQKISKKTKAIIVPHMFGLSADLDYLATLKIPIIEDCALSLGATYKNKYVGNYGVISIFSFYATKMVTTGEGGMVLTNNRSYYDIVNDLKNTDKKLVYKTRYNYNMTDLSASIGLVQLEKLPYFIQKRQELAKIYETNLSDLDIILPTKMFNTNHIYYRYVVQINNRANEIIRKLKKYEIDARTPVHNPLHRYLSLSDYDFTVTNHVFNSTVSLPIYPSLKEKEIIYICKILRRIL
jgi:perosamine synthetase